MTEALAQHDVLLKRVVAETGGVVFNHTGDGLACWFPPVASAVVAAANGQKELSAAVWSTGNPPRVRMAIHVGDAEAPDGGWFGPALNRCARLLGIAHGGQVILSGAAKALLVEGLPSGMELAALGTHRLRDLAAPEEVFQLVGRGLAQSFPPLRSVELFRGNLPSESTSFIGRRLELTELTQALTSRRLISQDAAGGMGKTRLALQMGAAVVDKSPDGVWFVELAPLSDPGAVDHVLVPCWASNLGPA